MTLLNSAAAEEEEEGTIRRVPWVIDEGPTGLQVSLGVNSRMLSRVRIELMMMRGRSERSRLRFHWEC